MTKNNNGNYATNDPNPEVQPRAERRHYTSEYKQRILAEIDAAVEPGQVGAILRREGLYSQAISKWRQQLQNGALDALEPNKPGRKGDPHSTEIARLQRENERLRQKLERAETIIEVQKKVSQLLGLGETDLDEPKSSK
jgi:transposase